MKQLPRKEEQAKQEEVIHSVTSTIKTDVKLIFLLKKHTHKELLLL